MDDEELNEKKLFVDEVSGVLKNHLEHLVGIEYHVFRSKSCPQAEKEFIKIVFKGGGWLARNVTCDSKSAILMEIATKVDGGYYDEVEYYNSLANSDDIIEVV